MSRFRPRISRGVESLPPPPAVAVIPRVTPPAKLPVRPSDPPVPQLNIGQRLGFLILCAYMISGVLNEWSLRLLGIKAFLSTITLVLLPVFWLASGAGLRGLRHSIGVWWAAFLFLLVIATPFSIWPGGSAQVLFDYVPRGYMLLFYVAALTISFRNCRHLMYVNIATSFLALSICVRFGVTADDGRYMVPGGAGFFQNSNELALALLLGITHFAYLLSQKNRVGKVIAVGGIALSAPFILWTGSRGCVIAAAAYACLLLFLSRQRLRAVVLIAALAGVGVLFAPSAVLHRITLLTGDEEITSSADASAVASQMSRISLLKRSVAETIAHPLFGVGPGQFPVAVMEQAKAKNEWFQWLGTHNSYTQISSECGIPAFICYLVVIILCLKLNFALWRRTRNRPDQADIMKLSVALLSGSVVYAVGSFFFHMAYTGTLPFIAGQTLALHFASKQNHQQSGDDKPILSRA
jgi:O-antigen ligase